MRILILFCSLLVASLAVGCSDNSGNVDSDTAQPTSSTDEDTSLSVNMEENSASFSNGDTSISINAEDHKANQEP